MLSLRNAGRFAYLRFLIISIAHPIIFISYWYLFTTGPHGTSSVKIFGIDCFWKEIPNEFRINLVFFVIYALFIYYCWLQFQMLVMKAIKEFDEESFINAKLSAGPWTSVGPWVNVFGVYHLFVWTVGMEGNVFGFIFFLPLLVFSCVTVGKFIVELIGFHRGKFGKTETV